MGLTGLSGDYECADTRNDIQSCGGCASTGAGTDCTAIDGAWNVGCHIGKCASTCLVSPSFLFESLIRPTSLLLRRWLQAFHRRYDVHQALSGP